MTISISRMLVLGLVLAAGGCKRSPPPAAVVDAAEAPARPADPKAAKAANKQGMKHYRKKNYGQAATAFRAAIAADPSHLLAHYNLACVLALSGDAAGATAELEWLAKSPDPQAARQLAKAGSDDDLTALAKDQKVKALIEAAAERALFPGFVILARGQGASPDQTKKLAELNPPEEGETAEPRAAKALTGELASDGKGPETLIASAMNSALLDRAGAVLAEGSLASLMEGLWAGREPDLGLAHLWVGQVVPDPEPEIVLQIERSSSMSNGSCDASDLIVLKRQERGLVDILAENLQESCIERNDSEPEDPYANPDSSESHTDLQLRPDGTILRRERGKKSGDTLRWSAKKFAYVADGERKKP